MANKNDAVSWVTVTDSDCDKNELNSMEAEYSKAKISSKISSLIQLIPPREEVYQTIHLPLSHGDK